MGQVPHDAPPPVPYGARKRRRREERPMGKVSKKTANVQDHGLAEEWTQDVEGYTINFVNIREGHDLAPMLAGLPGGNCSCPHWGYLLEGRITVRYDDHEEVIEAGDAFYMPPGHAPEAEAGTELIQISPARELATVEEALMKLMQDSHSA